MTEWLKHICLSPFKYGLDKANFMAVKAISLIFNSYGRRLLKMDIDEIIKHNECIDDHDIFYLYPLCFKEIEHKMGANLILIKTCQVEDLVISIPWKNMLNESTHITMQNIHMVISLAESNSIYQSAIENSNSYFASDNNINKTEDLATVYKEINTLLVQYCNKIDLEINILKINVDEYFVIEIHNIVYSDNIIKIFELTIKNDFYTLLEISQIVIDTDKKTISIGSIILNPLLVQFLPNFYMDDTVSDIHWTLKILRIKIDDLDIESINIEIKAQEININFLALTITNILYYRGSEESIILKIDMGTNLCRFYQQLQLNISDFYALRDLIERLRMVVDKGLSKIMRVNSDDTFIEKTLRIENLRIEIIHGNDLLNLSIKQIKGMSLNGLSLDYKNIVVYASNIIISPTIFFNGLKIEGDEFGLEAANASVTKDTKKLDILFEKANATNIIKIIDEIKTLVAELVPAEPVDMSRSVKSLEQPLEILLGIKSSSIGLVYDGLSVDLIVHTADINITKIIAKNILMEVAFRGFILTELNIDELSTDYLKVLRINTRLDPEIFDELVGILSPEKTPVTEDEAHILSQKHLGELQEALSRSVYMENMEQMIYTLNQSIIYNNNSIQSSLKIPCVKLLTQSICNFIDDYAVDVETGIKIQIETFHLNLYDKIPLDRQKVSDGSFLCVVLKDLSFKKIIEEVKNVESIARVTEKGFKKSSNIQSKYLIEISTGAFIDSFSHNPEWKYFLKFSQRDMFNAEIIVRDDRYKIKIDLASINANIREETLIRLLAFFSHSNHTSQHMDPTFIDDFSINTFNISVNYYPLIVQKMDKVGTAFTLRDFRIKLHSQKFNHVEGFDRLASLVFEQWKHDINPDNILQFVPSIKIIKPYSTPIVYIIQLTSKYFQNPHNKKRIRMVTRGINRSTDFVGMLVKCGLYQISDLFN